MGGLGSGGHEGIGETRKRQRKKGGDEKSAFLFSFSAFIPG